MSIPTGRSGEAIGAGTASVVVPEHHKAVMAHADWIIDIGPGGGHDIGPDIGPGGGPDGGQVVFTGTPASLVAEGETVAARHLRGYVAGWGQVGGQSRSCSGAVSA